ncbi:MAG TPA: hypothetical protein ENK59_08940 [Thioploca sp.]|nr:hypothetical protein [Thioploca sp.]
MKIKHLLIVLLLSLLTACNESDTNSDNIAGGGIGGTGVNIGPISAFGSIFVNGIEFDTSNAIILKDGQMMTENDLQIGMVVRVESTIDKVLHIYFNENVRGPIQAIDNNNLIILGQRIILNQLTVFDGNIADLNIGDIINVSGLINADGAIQATWIEREIELQEFELVGKIVNLNTIKQTFEIGAITIDYSQPLRLDIAELQNGLLVEVKGTFLDNILLASSIEAETFDIAIGTTVEMEGFITQFDNQFFFKIGRFPVEINSQTVFHFGNVVDLALGIKVEVHGELNINGSLLLDSVTFLDIASQRTPSGRIDIDANIEAIKGETINLLGIPIQTTSSTQFRDRREMLTSFGVQQLQIGDRVVMSGFLDLTSNTLIAEVLLRKPYMINEEISLTGPIDNLKIGINNEFTILGIKVLTDKETIYEDEHLGGTELTIDFPSFFANVQQSLIEVQGIFIDDVILAKRLEIER